MVAQVAQREHGVNRELQQGSHLFSGGLGGLGLLTARALVESGAKRLVHVFQEDCFGFLP